MRNVKPLWSKLGTFVGIALGGLDMWTNTFGFSLFGTLGARQARLRHAQAGGRVQADRLSEARRHAHLRPAVVGVPVQHQSRGRSAGSSARQRHGAAEDAPNMTSSPDRRSAIARPASMNGSRRAAQPAIRHQRAELRPLQNLRHQGPEAEHHLGSAGRRRRAELSEYVIPAGGAATIPPHRGFQPRSRRAATAVLAGGAQKGHSRPNLGGSRDNPRPAASLEHRP